MTRPLRVLAPAKINWTLEVLGRRPDGYHEIRSVMQTIDLCDSLMLRESSDISLQLRGETRLLEDEPVQDNLAFRAAVALQRHAGKDVGVRISLDKHIPIAAGLGGGSSDAAAVLRGCNALWQLDLDDATLIEIAAGIGSDVPFFIVGGTASVSGRGEIVRPLPDVGPVRLLMQKPEDGSRTDKTSSMYMALSPEDFTDGNASRVAEEVVSIGLSITDRFIRNIFERVLPHAQPASERAMQAIRELGRVPHLAGSGPSVFLLDDDSGELAEVTGESFMRVSALGRGDALRIGKL